LLLLSLSSPRGPPTVYSIPLILSDSARRLPDSQISHPIASFPSSPRGSSLLHSLTISHSFSFLSCLFPYSLSSTVTSQTHRLADSHTRPIQDGLHPENHPVYIPNPSTTPYPAVSSVLIPAQARPPSRSETSLGRILTFVANSLSSTCPTCLPHVSLTLMWMT
jgi:hypothetical protein